SERPAYASARGSHAAERSVTPIEPISPHTTPGAPPGAAFDEDGKKSAARSLLLHDVEQLDLEDERRAGLDRGRRAAVAVGDVRRAHEPTLASHLHELQ